MKFDTHYLMKNGSWVTLRYAVITLAGILLSITFSRLVTKEVYGQYQFVITLISFLALFSLPGLNMVSLRESVKGNDQALLQAVQKSMKYGFLITLITFGYAGYLFFIGQLVLALALVIAGLFAPFYYAPNNWYVFYEGKKNFYSSSFRLMIVQIFLLIFLCFALFLRAPLPVLVGIYFFLPAVFSWYYFFEVRRHIDTKVLFHTPLDMHMGVMVTIQKFISGLSEYLAVFFITLFFGFELLAVYQVSNMLVLAIVGLAGALFSLYFPHIVENGKTLTPKSIGISLLAGIPSVAILYFFLQFFFLIFYGEAYRESLLLGYALLGIVFLAPLKILLTNFYTIHGENGRVIGANIFAVLLLIGSLFLTKNEGFHKSLVVSFYLSQVGFIIFLIGVALMRRSDKKG